MLLADKKQSPERDFYQSGKKMLAKPPGSGSGAANPDESLKILRPGSARFQAGFNEIIMEVEKKDLGKGQIELNISLGVEEFAPYLQSGAETLSREIKIEGFRPGKAPLAIVKQRAGEMAVLEAAARLAIDKTLWPAIKEQADGELADTPEISVTKLAPDNPLGYKAILTFLPEVKLGEYKNFGIKENQAEVAESEVLAFLERLADSRAKETLSLAAAKTGDKVIVDLEMFLDNVPLEGGQTKDTSVIIGQKFIVDGFDKQLLGLNKNETREFSLPYPADFHQKNLAGKLVQYRVRVKDIFRREKPAIDDEFAKTFNQKNLAELKENIKNNLQAEKNTAQRQAMEDEIIKQGVKNAHFGDLPELMIKNEGGNLLRQVEEEINGQGGNFADYLAHLKKTREQFLLDLLPNAVERIKISLFLRAVGRAEKIEATEAEVQHQLEALKKYYQNAGLSQSDPERYKQMDSPAYRRHLGRLILDRKTIDKLRALNTAAAPAAQAGK